MCTFFTAPTPNGYILDIRQCQVNVFRHIMKEAAAGPSDADLGPESCWRSILTKRLSPAENITWNQDEDTNGLQSIFVWRGGRVAYRAGLENRSPARDREFESLPLRQHTHYLFANNTQSDKENIIYPHATLYNLTPIPAIRVRSFSSRSTPGVLSYLSCNTSLRFTCEFMAASIPTSIFKR